MTPDLVVRMEPGDDGPPRLRVAGEIDLSNVERFRQSLSTGAPAGSALIVDLTGISYIDSAGISALFERARRGGLEIVADEDSVVAPLIRITRLDQLAVVRPSSSG